jgi:hypothetical protein
MFSKCFLLEAYFKRRKMSVKDLQFKVVRIDKTIIEFSFNQHIGCKQLMFKLGHGSFRAAYKQDAQE